jgi:phosphomannomutase
MQSTANPDCCRPVAGRIAVAGSKTGEVHATRRVNPPGEETSDGPEMSERRSANASLIQTTSTKGLTLVTPPRLIAFDLDDTLAPSKSPLDPRMAGLLARLLQHVEVCIISGGQFQQFQKQVVDMLPAMTESELSRFHLMPTCGTQYYRHADGWHQVYAQTLTEAERDSALLALESVAKELGYWETDTFGPILEDRGSQITFSALGQNAPVARKMEWDPSGVKKAQLREAVQLLLPTLEARSGGSTSIDITRRGVDKAYGMEKLSQVTNIAFEEMLFIGDRLDPEGNDFPVIRLGIPTHAVSGWEDTATYLDNWLESESR